MKTKMIILGLLFLFFVLNFAGDCDTESSDETTVSNIDYNYDSEKWKLTVVTESGKAIEEEYKLYSNAEAQGRYYSYTHNGYLIDTFGNETKGN